MTLKGLATAWVESKAELVEAEDSLEKAKKLASIKRYKLACLSEDLINNCDKLRIIGLDEGYVLVRKSHGVELVPKEPVPNER